MAGQRATGKRPILAAWQRQPYAAEPSEPLAVGANLGIQTGRVEGAPLCVVVVDLDSDAALAWARAGNLPSTPWRTLTAHGEHWYYRAPSAGRIPNRCRLTLADGTRLEIDVRGDGGNVVVAPSVHYSGAVYAEAAPWEGVSPDALPLYDPAWLDGRKRSAAMGRPRTHGAFADAPTAPARDTPGGAEPPLEAPSSEPPSERPGMLPEAFQARLYERLARGAAGDAALRAVRAMRDGEMYAPEGERNNALFQATRLLAEWFPDATDAQLIEFATPSVVRTGSRTADEELEVFRETLARARAKFAERDNVLARLFAADVQPTDALVSQGADLRRRLILSFAQGTHAIMRPDGSYNPTQFRPTMLAQHVAHPDMLAWAERGGLAEFSFVTATGASKRVSWPTILERHSHPIHHWRGEFTAARSYVDGNVFVEAVAPRRDDLSPRFDPAIEAWLRALGGSLYEVFADYLATFVRLDLPAPALMLIGAAQGGKNLLVEGLARYWRHGVPVPFEASTANFNEALERCPLLFADEKLPREGRARAELSEHIRQLVTARQHDLNRKFLPVVTVHGCVRIAVATNDDRFQFGGMNAESKAALSERMLVIDVGPGAVRALAAARQGKERLSEWVEGDGIIRHVLHLAATREVKLGPRLTVTGNGEALINRASNSTGINADLCQWLCSYLLHKASVGGKTQDRVLPGNGELWVNVNAFDSKATWELFVQHAEGKLPSVTALGRALASLSGGHKRTLSFKTRRGDEIRGQFHRVDVGQLLAWADRAGFGDLDAIREAIAEPGPELGTMVVLSTLGDVAPANDNARGEARETGAATTPVTGNDTAPVTGCAVSPQGEVVPVPAPTPAPAPPVLAAPAPTPVLALVLEAPPAKGACKGKAPLAPLERTASYYTPADLGPLAALSEALESERDVIEWFAPVLLAAQAGEPSTYARTVAAYRAYRTGGYEAAIDAWFDRGVARGFLAPSCAVAS